MQISAHAIVSVPRFKLVPRTDESFEDFSSVAEIVLTHNMVENIVNQRQGSEYGPLFLFSFFLV